MFIPNCCHLKACLICQQSLVLPTSKKEDGFCSIVFKNITYERTMYRVSHEEVYKFDLVVLAHFHTNLYFETMVKVIKAFSEKLGSLSVQKSEVME